MIKFPIDFVFPYVDNKEEIWRKNYIEFCSSNPGYKDRLRRIDTERYDDLGFLRYIFRGIDDYMPYIRNVFLIVSNIEQVPQWINKDKVKIVLHKDIIPEEYLPTYNSTTIEMFLHKIPGLAEHFIYSNDDIYIINETSPEDFFNEKGNPKISLNQHRRSPQDNMFNEVCYRSYNDLIPMTWKSASSHPDIYYRPEHGLHPMLKSHCAKVFNFLKNKIDKSITVFRTNLNYNQYLYTNYAYLSGNYQLSTVKFKYMRLENSVLEASSTVAGGNYQVICLNDTAKTDRDAWRKNKFLLENSFETKFPNKSKYEV